tara:strand:- start:194 stop:619 length:426 start_codon:yes stop_codon:yes gene_type:complete
MRKTIIHERLEKLRSINFWIELMSNPDTKQFVIRLNQNRLELFGTDIDNNVIGYYSPSTEIMSGGEKQAGKPYNLKDTGYFYNSFKIDVFSNYIVIDADGLKDNVDWSDPSEKVLGLAEYQFEILNLYLVPKLIKLIKREL